MAYQTPEFYVQNAFSFDAFDVSTVPASTLIDADGIYRCYDRQASLLSLWDGMTADSGRLVTQNTDDPPLTVFDFVPDRLIIPVGHNLASVDASEIQITIGYATAVGGPYTAAGQDTVDNLGGSGTLELAYTDATARAIHHCRIQRQVGGTATAGFEPQVGELYLSRKIEFSSAVEGDWVPYVSAAERDLVTGSQVISRRILGATKQGFQMKFGYIPEAEMDDVRLIMNQRSPFYLRPPDDDYGLLWVQHRREPKLRQVNPSPNMAAGLYYELTVDLLEAAN